MLIIGMRVLEKRVRKLRWNKSGRLSAVNYWIEPRTNDFDNDR